MQPGMVRTDLWNQGKTDVKGKWAAFITGTPPMLLLQVGNCHAGRLAPPSVLPQSGVRANQGSNAAMAVLAKRGA